MIDIGESSRRLTAPISTGLILSIRAITDQHCELDIIRDRSVIDSSQVPRTLVDPAKPLPREVITDLTTKIESKVDEDELPLGTHVKGAVVELRFKLLNHRKLQCPTIPKHQTIHQCAAPTDDSLPVCRERRWKKIERRYEDWRSRKTLEIWADDPGLGKTTSTARGVLASGDSHVVYLPTHENVTEFLDNESIPGDYFHLKGPQQPREKCCMKAKTEGETCNTESCNGGMMCPVFDLQKDDPRREEYEKLGRELGSAGAHRVFDFSTVPGHPTEEKCAWQRQFDGLSDRTNVVTVHAYLDIPIFEDFDAHIVDDLQSLLEDETQLTHEQLRSISEVLCTIEDSAIGEAVTVVRKFVDHLSLCLTDKETSLSEFSLGSFPTPSWVSKRLSLNDDCDEIAEILAWVKHAYCERVYRQTITETWDGAPLSLDPVLAAFAEINEGMSAVLKAIDTSVGVVKCPSCGAYLCDTPVQSDSHTSESASKSECSECGWSEADDVIIGSSARAARVAGSIREIKQGSEADDPVAVLNCVSLPRLSDLPDPNKTLLLDATPSIELYRLLFGLPKSSVHIEGRESISLNATVTQCLDGQYHRYTITSDESANRREKIQRLIDQTCDSGEEVIVVGHGQAEDLFVLPDNAEWIKFYAGRGLDRLEANKLIVIGAPHPNIEGLTQVARALTRGTDISVGGEECDLTRTYNYDRGDGIGFEVETKGFTGLVGVLFEDKREKELVQMLHRIRPAVAKFPKEILLITSVPLSTPIDTLTTIDELLAPQDQALIGANHRRFIESLLDGFEEPLPENDWSSAFSMNNGVLTGTVADYQALAEAAGITVSERTIRNRLSTLSNWGLIEHSEQYKKRTGRPHTVSQSTLKRALQYTTNNAGFKPEQRQYIRHLMEEGTQQWLNEIERIVGTSETAIEAIDDTFNFNMHREDSLDH